MTTTPAEQSPDQDPPGAEIGVAEDGEGSTFEPEEDAAEER
jgi:hypothetical protein